MDDSSLRRFHDVKEPVEHFFWSYKVSAITCDVVTNPPIIFTCVWNTAAGPVKVFSISSDKSRNPPITFTHVWFTLAGPVKLESIAGGNHVLQYKISGNHPCRHTKKVSFATFQADPT